jgi:uncharacterized membrane protein YdfJ with MMPL/SSD domain
MAMVAFWTSVPLFAVSLALYGPLRDLAWPVVVLWVVVLVSSAYLTPQAFPPVPREGVRSETRQTSESLVYPITLLLTFPVPAFQLF